MDSQEFSFCSFWALGRLMGAATALVVDHPFVVSISHHFKKA
jgi:hypothetical protein